VPGPPAFRSDYSRDRVNRDSKDRLDTKLNDARKCGLRGDRPKCCSGYGGIGRREVRVVEGVDRVRPNLQLQFFPQADISKHRNISGVDSIGPSARVVQRSLK